MVDVVFAGPAEDDAVVVALAVEVHVHHRIVVQLFDRIVHVVKADHLGMAELFIDALSFL